MPRALLVLALAAGCRNRYDGTYRVLYEFKGAACSDGSSPVGEGFALSTFTMLDVYHTEGDRMVVHIHPTPFVGETEPLSGTRDGHEFTVRSRYARRDLDCGGATVSEITAFEGTFTEAHGIKGTLTNKRVAGVTTCEGEEETSVTCKVRWRVAGYMLEPGEDTQEDTWWGSLPHDLGGDTGGE